ncbi:MAG TPA: metallophosphoesterase [Bacillales bacterium]
MAVFIMIVIAAVIGFLLYMWIEAHLNKVQRIEFVLDRLPEGFNGMTLFFISDVHRRVISDKVIQEARGEADIVIIGGDLTEKGVPFQRVEENIDKLLTVAPIYFVWGNNDYETDFRRLDTLLHEKGVVVLDNTAARLESNGETLFFLGVDDYGLERSRLDLALADSPEGFRLLISHNPDIAQELDAGSEIPLILSGHTHGGQIRLFGWGPREKGGVKEFPGLRVFISNGYGTTSIPFRLGAPAETHLITLKNK